MKVFNIIKRLFDTNILDGLIEESIKKKSLNQIKNEKISKIVTKFSQYCFVNTAYNSVNGANLIDKKRWNSLINNVIYDSECNHFLTFDKSRFLNEIMPENEKNWMNIFDEKMQMADHKIMIIKTFLHDQMKELLFSNTAYIFISKFTLISIKKLKRKEFIWNMHKNILQVKITDENICEIFKKYELTMIEYNSM